MSDEHVRSRPGESGAPTSNAESRRSSGGNDRSSSGQASSRRAFLGLAGAGAATVLAGCISGSRGESTPEVSYRHRFKRIGLVPSLHDAGVEMGTWNDEGLDVDFKTSSGAQATAKAVANGEDDFGDGGMKIVLKAIESGAPLVILGQELDPIRGIVALRESGIESWADLEGTTIGKMPFAMSKVSKEIMRQKGVDVSTVTFQNVEPAAQFDLLLEGELDALNRYVPQAVDELDYMGHDPVGLYSSNVVNYLGPCVYTRKEMVEENPEVVDTFVRGWEKNFQLFATETEAVLDAYTPKVPGEFNVELEKQTLPELWAAQSPTPSVGTTHGKGWTVEEQMEITLETFADAGILEQPDDPGAYYTNEFIEANQDLAVETANTLYEALESTDIGPDFV